MAIPRKLRGALRSLTMWFNGLLGSVLVALPAIQDAMPQLKGYVPANAYHWLAGALVLGNIVLRVRTSTSLGDKAKQ